MARLSELVGWAMGWALAPIAAVGSSLREARLLHPEGVVYKARVEPLPTEGPLERAAIRLHGDAMVRLSTALWRGGKEWIDVLGIAVRFRGSRPPSEEPSPGDQDLLFATIRRPLTMLLAPLTTDQRSFLRNDFYAVSPFDMQGVGRVRLRLVAPRIGEETLSRGRPLRRDEELLRAASLGLATFRLEAKRQKLGSPWRPVAQIRLIEPALVDQAALRFSPFRVGQGITPRGFVHALRRGVYWASQRARPAHAHAHAHL
jgi:hypothetical protein